MHIDYINLRPDSKGRVTLGKLAEGVSSFHAYPQDDGKIILEPYAEIPAKEKWLFQNKKAIKKVLEGLDQSAKGKTKHHKDFPPSR